MLDFTSQQKPEKCTEFRKETDGHNNINKKHLPDFIGLIWIVACLIALWKLPDFISG